MTAGVHRVVWDGRDDAGREVASGGYLARLWVDDVAHLGTADDARPVDFVIPRFATFQKTRCALAWRGVGQIATGSLAR